jgi:hypothetical protein
MSKVVDQMLKIKNDDSWGKKKDSMKQIYRNMKNVKAGTVYLRNTRTYCKSQTASVLTTL